MNKARILLVGEYPPLLDTRALILKEYDCETSSWRQAIELLSSGSFDLVMVGQSVPGERALEIVNAAKNLDSAPALIAIRFDQDGTDLGVETHTCDLGQDPGWLGQRVAFLLAERSASN